MSKLFAVLIELRIFKEFPEVEIAINISPELPNPSICRENTDSYPVSLDHAVKNDESVVKARAGKLLLSNLNRPINSAAICCASAALPPFPTTIIFFSHSLTQARVSVVRLGLFFS